MNVIKRVCPRCNRLVKGRGHYIQNGCFGPKCAKVVVNRVRLRESLGSSELTERVCSVTHIKFWAKEESDAICGQVCCTACPYNSLKFVDLKRCPLQQESISSKR